MPPPATSDQSTKKQAPDKPQSRSPRTTVLHICADLEPGDPSRETVDLAILTQRAGWRALIASRGGRLVHTAERAAVRHTRMPIDRKDMLASWHNRIRLAALVQKERPALVHAHGLDAAAHVSTVARVHRLPLIADFTQPLPDNPRTHRVLKQLQKISCTIRVPSRFMAQQLRNFQWPAERLHIVPPGIDLKTYHAGFVSPERLQGLSRLWRLPEQASLIVMPMPFVEGGGHKQLLEALAQIKSRDIFLALVGDNRPAPAWHAEIDALVDSLGLGGKVIMPDYCLDWPAACWLASIIVATNDVPRGQTVELLAAQAIGRPVIVSDCGANSEMVRSGETAWLIPPNDIHALAQALTEAINLETSQRLDLTHRTRDFIAGTFPQANWFDMMMDLYETNLAPISWRRKAAAA